MLIYFNMLLRNALRLFYVFIFLLKPECSKHRRASDCVLNSVQRYIFFMNYANYIEFFHVFINKLLFNESYICSETTKATLNLALVIAT